MQENNLFENMNTNRLLIPIQSRMQIYVFFEMFAMRRASLAEFSVSCPTLLYCGLSFIR